MNTEQAEPQVKAAHTPGPWEWYHVGIIPGDGCLRLDAANGQNILITDETKDEYGYNPLPSEADANLIAAAPELLEALKELADLVDAIRTGDYSPDSFTTQPARAAIAKAQP